MATNSLLTDTQREFLQLSEEDREEKYTKQQRSYHRSAIRDRIRASVEDLALLLEYGDWDEIEEAVDEVDIANGLAFFLADLVPSSDEVPEEMGEEKPGRYATDGDRIQFLELVLERALEDACDARNHNRQYDIDLDIVPREIDPRSAGELQNQLREGEISPDDVEDLYQEGRISRDTFATVVVESDAFDED